MFALENKQVGRKSGDHFLEELVIGIREISFWKKEKFGGRNFKHRSLIL